MAQPEWTESSVLDRVQGGRRRPKAGVNKRTHETFLKPTTGKCLHYYFYFIDEELGLCYLRVPTWCPFRLQFYFNGHSWLARQLDGIKLLAISL